LSRKGESLFGFSFFLRQLFGKSNRGVNVYLIAGLGNPGDKYRLTRHNIGFVFVDYLAERFNLSFSDSKWQAEVSQGMFFGDKVILVKPTTFMNLSGAAVGQIASYYKIPLDKILIVHDELDLPPGRVKMNSKRGAGGHNGIASIISHLSSKDFLRLRIGVGRPPLKNIEVSRHVLGKFPPEDRESILSIFTDLERGVALFIEKDGAAAMNYLNAIK